jgi:uncharacterized protein (DUF4213/DUF364 family)
MILNETLELIKSRYGHRINSVTIEKLVAGIYFTAVKLSNGYCGLAYTVSDSDDSCASNRNRGFGDFTPGNFTGQKVTSLFTYPDQSCFIKTIRLAAMNALSAELMTEPGYTIIENKDPFELLDLAAPKQVCVVGAFLSYLKKTVESGSSLKVIELNETAVPDEYKQFLVPAGKTEEVIAQSDVVIITGSSIANHTLDGLLEIIPEEAQVILVGPTSSLLPDIFFKRGVDFIGSTRITDTEKMFQLIAEGASGFHLFKSCAVKICLVNES